MKQFIIFLATLSISITCSFAQETENKLSLTNGSINDKFDYVITKSNNYQEFKVVKKSWLNTLKKQVLDSVNKQKTIVNQLSETIKNQKTNTNKLENKISELNTTITQINSDKEHISFLGADFKKSDFKNIFWAVASILALLLVFFIYKFKNSNTTTQLVKTQLIDIEKEFEEHRKIALEREQKVMRKLQDELNKNRS